MKLPAMLSALGVLLTVSVASAVPLGLTTAQTAHPRLTAEACRSSGFNPRLYDYAIETCTLDFTAMVPESLEDRGQVLQNRKACMAKRIDGLRQCRDRHKGGKAHAACNRKVNAAHRACLYEARVTAFMQPGPEKYRGLICDAARHGSRSVTTTTKTTDSAILTYWMMPAGHRWPSLPWSPRPARRRQLHPRRRHLHPAQVTRRLAVLVAVSRLA